MSAGPVVPYQPGPAPVQYEQELSGAKMLLASGLLPASVKSPEAALFVILTGRDLGLSPVQSLRSIHVIQGKIEVAADMQLGLFHRAGGRSHWSALTNDRAALVLAAPWLLEPHAETFDSDDAKRAKLGGDNWQKYPKAMLRSRCITAALKSIGFDPTAGAYAPGEIGGPEDGPFLEPADEATTAATVQVAGVETPDPAPEDDDQPPGERQALDIIEAVLPQLTVDQQIYVKEKLGDGANPAALLEVMRSRKLVPA